MLYTLGQYIMNVQSSIASEGLLTIFKFGVRVVVDRIQLSLFLDLINN